MDQQIVCEIRIAGHMQFKRSPFYKHAVHDNAHTAIVFRRHNANEQHP
jgi:hypothetical protein